MNQKVKGVTPLLHMEAQAILKVSLLPRLDATAVIEVEAKTGWVCASQADSGHLLQKFSPWIAL